MAETADRFQTLVETVERLRAPGGCPWDRAQTHASLAPFALEEAREVVAAISDGPPSALADELGDLLLQVLLHGVIGAEEGTFGVADILAALQDKLIRRHPHVFGTDPSPNSAAGVERRWAEIKAREARTERRGGGWLEAVSRTLPALAEAEALGSRAAKVGFDWETPEAAWPKVEEEREEFLEAWTHWRAASCPDGEARLAMAAELGDLLFAVVNVARLLGVDAESALVETNERFRRRFARVERDLGPDPQTLREAGLEALNAAWGRAKAAETRPGAG